jgi:hypothetical protein
MAEYGPLTLQQLSLNHLVQRSGQELAAGDLPAGLLEELRAARRVPGTYRITDFRLHSVVMSDGVDVTEEERGNIVPFYQEKIESQPFMRVKIIQGSSDMDCCSNKERHMSYFEAGELTTVGSHQHRALVGGQVREVRTSCTDSIRLDSAGGLRWIIVDKGARNVITSEIRGERVGI